jgi:hypothetical protein
MESKMEKNRRETVVKLVREKNRQKALERLKDLKGYCEEMTDSEITERGLWKEDVEALDYAIALLESQAEGSLNRDEN